MPATALDAPAAATVEDLLGPAAIRFTHHDGAPSVLDPDLPGSTAIVTGFGPTNAPTAGTLSVMLGTVELQRRTTGTLSVVISDLGAWNSRNVSWRSLTAVRDQMFAFLGALGLEQSATLRSHLDHANLVRAGRIARYLSRADFLEHRESLQELYADHGLLGSEIGVITDSLYTVADVLGPFEEGADRVLMVSGIEEAYFTELARLVLDRQATAGELGLGWTGTIGALYFRVLEGLAGYPKMSKSIPASSIHLNMTAEEITGRVMSQQDSDAQAAVLSAVELASGWDQAQTADARTAFARRASEPTPWEETKAEFCRAFIRYAEIWKRCAQ